MRPPSTSPGPNGQGTLRDIARRITPLLWRLALGAGITALVALGLLWLLAASLTARPGEWAHRVQWQPPGLAQPVGMDIGVPSLIRLLTQPSLAPLLSHRPWRVGRNTWHISALPAPEAGLQIHCAPCWLEHPRLASQAVPVSSLRLRVQRFGEALRGDWQLGEVHGSWAGQLSPAGIQLQLELPPTPVAWLYGAVADAMPDVRHAQLQGTLALQARLALPSGQLQLWPELAGLQVSGLGTEAMRQVQAPALPDHHPLVRAVIAVEDQRFFEHPGYELATWQQLLAEISPAHRLRGGSTLTQQLAKLLYTGGERTLLRKARELLYAVEMEQTLGKRRILQLYLHLAPWGGNARGAAQAARAHLGQELAAAGVAESVWLAAMLHAPNAQLAAWQRSGHVDMARSMWIARQLRWGKRGLRPRQLLAVEQALMQLRPPAGSPALP